MKINLTDEIWRILEKKNRHYFVHHNFSRLKIIRQKIPGPAPVKFGDPRPRSKTGPPVDPWYL